MGKLTFSENSIYHNLKRTAKLGLISIINREEFNDLIDKYYRDSNGILHCAYTWEPLNEHNIELDHIIPVSLGGGTVCFNCVPASSNVNGRTEKYNNYLFEWWTHKKEYNKELLEKLVNFMFEGYSSFVKKGFSLNEIQLEENDIDDFELQINNEVEEISEDKYLLKYKNPYIYYTFFKDCVERLNIEKYNIMFEDLKQTNIFNLLNEYDEYLYLFERYLNEKSTLDLSTIAINFNIPKMLSILKLNKENFISAIDNKINTIYKEIQKKLNYYISLDTLLVNLLNIPEIIFYEEITEDLLDNLIKKIKLSKEDKFNLLIDYFKLYKEWPKEEKTQNIYNFSIYNFMGKIRSGEIKLTENQYKEILELDSKFFMNQNNRQIEENIENIINFYEKYGRKPRQIHNPENDDEKYERILAQAIQRLKLKESTLEIRLKNKLLSIDSNFFENTNEILTRTSIEKILKFYETNKKWPLRSDSDSEISRLASIATDLRTKEDSLPVDLVKKIKTYDDKFFMNQNERHTDDTIQLLLDFYEINKRWPIKKNKPKNDLERYETILAGRLQNIRFGGINISRQQRIELESMDETVFLDQRLLKRIKNYITALEFYDKNERWARSIEIPKSKQEQEEKIIGEITRNIRNSNCIPEKYKKEFEKRDANFFMNQNDKQTKETIIQIIGYFDKYNQWPQNIENPITEAEIEGTKIFSAMHNFKMRINSKILETHKELIFEILKRDLQFFENSGERSIKEKLNKAKKMYIKNNHWPTSREDKKLNEFLYNVKTGKIAITKIQLKEIIILDESFDISRIKIRPLYIYDYKKTENGKDSISKRVLPDGEQNNKKSK